MSAIGTKRTSLFAPHMSAIGGKADISCTNVRFAYLKQVCSGASLTPLSPLSIHIVPSCFF